MSQQPSLPHQSQSTAATLLSQIEVAKPIFHSKASFIDGLDLIADIEQTIQQLDDDILQGILSRACERIREHVQKAVTHQKLQLPALYTTPSQVPATMPAGQDSLTNNTAKHRTAILDLFAGMVETILQEEPSETCRPPKPLPTRPLP